METQPDLSNIIKQYVRLQDQEQLMTVEQIKQSFDSIVQKINVNSELLSDVKLIKEIVQFALRSNEKHLCSPDVITHRLFIIFRDYYLNLLERWRNGEKLDDRSSFVFESISNLFLKLSTYISGSSISTLIELIFFEPLFNQINLLLEQISIDNKYLQDPQIKGIDNLFRTIQRLERNCFDNKKDDFLTKLFENIVKCICSPLFIEILIQSIRKETEDVGQRFLLHTCTDYIYSHSTDKRHKQSLIDIRQSLLRPFTQWLIDESSLFRFWNNHMIIILRQICFLLTLDIQINCLNILDKEIFDNYCQMIDSFVNILYSIIHQPDNSINNKLNQLLIGTITPNLYTMILSNQLVTYVKSKHMTSLILKLAENENDEIKLNTLRILSLILTEQDAKRFTYSNSISNLFIQFLNKTIDDLNQTLTFYNLLQCLQNLIQYDQIKDEFTKQNGVPVIIRCATETKFKPLQVQQPALEILLALTFNREAHRQLNENLSKIKPFLSSSHQGISRVVEGIVWKLEIEFETLTKPISYDNNDKYDIMLSFSNSDRELCLRIHDQLIKDDFRVWTDQNETYGMTMEAKSKIIDKCDYFIICMSDTYKQNSYCRCEAHYAIERSRQIISLVVTSNYRPDGWLSPIISGKIYIDFIKLDFDFAYIKIKNEIDRLRKYQKTDLIITTPIESIEISINHEYPRMIDQWTTENVKSFLISKDLNSLLPVVCEMNGILLHELYTMCSANRESMYHTLKNEIPALDMHNPSLTLLVYLRFLNEIEKHIRLFV